MKRIFSLILVFLLAGALASCGDEKKNAVKEKVTKEVSAEDGGTVSTSDDSVSIDIPADALENDTSITITVYETSSHTTKKGETRVSQVIECEPSGTVFKKPVIIKMKTDKAIKNKVVTAAVYDEAKGEWSYSEHGAYAVLMGNDAAGDPIMQTAAGDPIMLNAAGDPIMQSTGEGLAAAGDPIMLASAGDPIMTNAAGDPIMNAAAGDPIMMTTGHFTAYTFIALDSESDGTAPVDTDADADDSDDEDTDNDADADEPVYVPECGNGIVDEGEECDNGANSNELRGPEAACRPDCTLVRCGDSIVDEGEECDNGEDNGKTDCVYGKKNCKVCTDECKEEAGYASFCGDNYVDEDNGEVCDHGTDNGRTDCNYGDESCELCTTSCQPVLGQTSYCGDSIIDSSNEETCDEGSLNGTYGHCNGSCDGRAPYCGDGYVDEDDGETCDDGTALNGTYGHCNATCNGRSQYCGDGNIDSSNGEVCDNGEFNDEVYCAYGQTSCTVCNGDCQEEAGVTSYCGDGYIDEDHGEVCDHGDDNGRTDCNYGDESCELCTSECQPVQGKTSFCGDSKVDTENEETCDDGAALNGTYGHCNSSCNGRASYCGDGYVDEDEGETCDDGTDLNGTYGHCNATCNGLSPFCGDGNIDSSNGEVCDNGEFNDEVYCAYGQTSCTVCNGDCQEEAGVTSYCGDGYVDEDNGETCDHGTSDNGRTKCYYGEENCELCTTQCQTVQGETSFCGDGMIDESNEETCDDGAALNGTYGHCNSSCNGRASYCGDGYVDEDEGETCDDGADNGKYGHCNSTCNGLSPYCGDGIVQREDCSDYDENCVEREGLNEECDRESENGEITRCEYGETECTVCTFECAEVPGETSYCGDGKVDVENEEVCDKADPSVGEGEGIGSKCSDDCMEIIEVKKVLCTGQTKCYNDEGAVIDCPLEGEEFYGQDASYTARQSCTPQTYEKIAEGNGRSIVDDLSTGLRWCISDNGGNWNQAYDFCDTLDTGDGREWRLPTAKELMSIIDSGSSYPAVREAYFGSVFSSYNSYWSANYFLNSKTGEDEVLIMDVGYGHLSYDSYGKEEGSNNFACVSGDEYGVSGSFTEKNISGGTVVTDSATDLMWKAADNLNMTWEQALAYCENLDYAGFDDWRLPNRNEFATLLNYDKEHGESKSNFEDIIEGNYWTSTFAATYGGSAGAFIIDVGLGTMVAVGDTGVDTAYTLCVRSDVAQYSAVPACDESGYTPCEDPETGIVWSQDVNDSDDEVDYLEAAMMCRESKQGGISQWRVATISEIRTILRSDVLDECHVSDECSELENEDCYDSEICATGTAIETAFRDYTFMVSGTQTGEGEGYSWRVNFKTGAIESHQGEYIYVTPSIRCVKDDSIPNVGFPYTDEDNSLVWSELSEEKLSWDEANEYCTEDDEYAWRLPTIEELATLVQGCHDGGCAPDIYGAYSAFGDVSTLWSSTITRNQLPTHVETYYNVLDFMTASQTELTADAIRNFYAKVRCVADVDENPSPCDLYPCEDIENSDGTCSETLDGGYICGCIENAVWDGSECVIQE